MFLIEIFIMIDPHVESIIRIEIESLGDACNVASYYFDTQQNILSL